MRTEKVQLNLRIRTVGSGPEVIKLFSCSTQLIIKTSLLINMKMPTKVGIFIFISGNFHAQLCLARSNLQLLVIGAK